MIDDPAGGARTRPPSEDPPEAGAIDDPAGGAGLPAMVDRAGGALAQLWTSVLAGWHDEENHAALLDLGVRTRTLPEIAARYRTLVGDPEKGDLARRKLDAVAVAASAMLLSTRTPRRASIPRPITLTAFATCALLLAWLVWALWANR